MSTPAAAQTDTLRQVLEPFQLPVLPPRIFPDLNRAITGHGAENAPDLFVIAYYLVGTDPRSLDDTLRVAVFERATGTWTRGALERGHKGSVLAIHHTARHVFLDTHSNPSAGTLVVVSRGLTPVAQLDGWLLRILPEGVVLYHKNQVHVAPTHPAELWTWNEVTGREALLYPAKPYAAVRRRYVETTRALYARLGEDWFREHNHSMDPDQFGSRLDTLVTNQTGTDAAFVVHFGENSGQPADPPPLEVVVTCRGITTTRPACAEAELADAQAKHPGWGTLQLLNDLMGNPPRPDMAGANGAEALGRMIGFRARFRGRSADRWRYGMLNTTRVPYGCFMVLLFGPDRLIRSEVWLDSVATLEISEVFDGSRGFDDWVDTALPAETWIPVPVEIVQAAIARCRARR
jgi:hypothetical protein